MPTKKRGLETREEAAHRNSLELCRLANSVFRLKLALQKTLNSLGVSKEEADQIISSVRGADFTSLESFLKNLPPPK